MNPLTKLKTLLLSLPDKSFVKWETREILNEINLRRREPDLCHNILFGTDSGVTSSRCCNEELIISLSTFGDRIHGTAITIESLLEQTVKANRIILNLGRQFEGKGKIPGSLKLLERRGLEIRFTRDIGSYTKLLPTLYDQPNATIISVDDDVIYHYDFVSSLVNEHIQHPRDIIAPRCRIMETNGNKLLSDFASWKFAQNGTEANIHYIPEGVMGILYPPNSLDERVFDEKMILDLCPSTDDFWFKAMSMLKGTLVRKSYSKSDEVLHNISSDMSHSLHQVNSNGAYERQLLAVLNHYDLWPWLENHHKAWLKLNERD